jgi:hypothetical protein
VNLYIALKKAKSPFSVELNPKNAESFEGIIKRKLEEKTKEK